MNIEFESNPQKIEHESFRRIRQLVSLNGFSLPQQQVVLRIIHSSGIPEISDKIRFSEHSCTKGLQALSHQRPILCDSEMVKQGLTKRFLSIEPVCYINSAQVIADTQNTNKTRSMVAVQCWESDLENSIVIIGNAPTALFQLLVMLAQGAPKPALIIAMPVGFVGAAESKQALWDCHQKLKVECITLLGRQGGSAIAAAVCNALLRCIEGEMY